MFQGSVRASGGRRDRVHSLLRRHPGIHGLAETMRPSEFRALLDRFYATSADVLVAMRRSSTSSSATRWWASSCRPSRAGRTRSERSRPGSRSCAPRATTATRLGPDRDRREHGLAYVGAVGTAEHVEFTALGDAVNVRPSRLGGWTRRAAGDGSGRTGRGYPAPGFRAPTARSAGQVRRHRRRRDHDRLKLA